MIEALVTITTSIENTSEYGRELKRAKNQATTRRVSGRRTNSVPISSHDEDATADLDENDSFIAAICCESNTTVLSRIVPLHEEVAKYIQIMKQLAEDSRDAMQFWSTHYLALPILFSIVKMLKDYFR